MSVPIPLRRDFGASRLRSLAKKTKDGPQARRLLTLAAIYNGGQDRRRRSTDHPGLGVTVQCVHPRPGFRSLAKALRIFSKSSYKVFGSCGKVPGKEGRLDA
jgi:hypothetical protein